MLQIRNLTLTHKKDLRTIIENFTFTLNQGDKVVIIGEEGNGKSTLLKAIYNHELIENYIESTGDVIKQTLRLGYLPQELEDEDKSLSIYQFCSDIVGFFDLSHTELYHICNRLSIPIDLLYSEQLVDTLSGGEKVKLQLLRLLVTSPDILLLDEPSNDLDMKTVEWLESFISSSQVPIIYISHDEKLIENTANVVIHLEQLMRKTKAVYTIAKTDYITYKNERSNRLDKQEQEAYNERREYKKQMERFLQIQQKVEHGLNAVSRQDPHGGQLLKKKMKSVKSMGKRMERKKEEMTEVPDVEDSMFIKFAGTKAIPNGKKVIDIHIPILKIGDKVLSKDITLMIKGSEKICIIGQNGSGKSTLLKAFVEELTGRVDIHVAYMPQNYEEMLEMELSAVEYLSENGDKEELTRIRTYLGSMKYTRDEMEHPMRELSGGQKAKVLLLKMSLAGNNVLLLDEPTRNFSPLSAPVIREVLRDFKGAIISISHDRKYMEEVCDTIYELKEDGLFKVNK